jgi:hypothetical protein
MRLPDRIFLSQEVDQMRLERLFNVLVVGGAALGAGCAGGSSEGGAIGGGGSTSTSTTSATAEGAGGASAEGGIEGGAGTEADARGDVTERDAGALVCPQGPAPPNAPCGCICCWASNTCINTDECCAAFRSKCTPR